MAAGEDEEKGRGVRGKQQQKKEMGRERQTEGDRWEGSGKNRCLDLIQKNIFGTIFYAPAVFLPKCADIPFESCYQVKHSKNKNKCSRDKGLNRLETNGK